VQQGLRELVNERHRKVGLILSVRHLDERLERMREENMKLILNYLDFISIRNQVAVFENCHICASVIRDSKLTQKKRNRSWKIFLNRSRSVG
jgi:hypothetical protein